MSAILTAQELEKSFGPRRILTQVSFAIHERDRIGLIGRNGTGKSTLLKMLVAGALGGSGVEEAEAAGLQPDGGLITWKRELRLEYVPQEPRLPLDATVGELLERGAPAHEVRGLSAALGVAAPDTRIGRLSIGEQRRVALARALLGRADLLCLDEPTNHLDARTVRWLEERLASGPGAVLLITHDRYFLDRVATRILELDRGRIHATEGDYSTFLERQAERLGVEETHERERASFVRNELDWIRRGPSARGVKQKARIQRFDAAVAAKPTVGERPMGQVSLRLPTGGRLGRTILETEKLTRSIGGKRLFSDLTLAMKPGDRIGIVGANGVGKTTLLRTLLGMDPPDSGRAILGQNTRVTYLEQGRSELDDSRTVLEEVSEGSDHVLLEDGPIHVRSFLKMLLFTDEAADTPIGKLSGGERNRVQLARLLRRGGNLVILDEPTNDLDLHTLGALEEALIAFPGCALIVSHDRWFLDRVATGILAFEGDGEVAFWEGSYTSYEDKQRAMTKQAAQAVAPKTTVKDTGKPTGKSGPRKLTFKERAELAGMEPAIVVAEERVATLEATLSDPSIFKDRGAEVPGLIAGLEAARAHVQALYDRWQELEALAPS